MLAVLLACTRAETEESRPGSSPAAVSSTPAAASDALPALLPEASSARRTEPPRRCVDPAALDALVAAAARAQSDTLLVVQDGVPLVDKRFGREARGQPLDPGPIETRSLTKGIVALGVLGLIADGKVRSLDVPLSEFFPEFRDGPRATITLRHVLTHTTGLRHATTDADALNAEADRLAYARSLPVVEPPGSTFSYSNEACQLLSGVFPAAAGEPVDSYVARRIFAPLGIAEAPWKRDRSGTPQTYYGVALRARDLAKIGQLLLDEGVFEGRRVLPAELTRLLFLPSDRFGGYGLGFWLDPPVVQTRARVDVLVHDRLLAPHVAEALAPLDGRRFDSGETYFAALGDRVDASTVARLRALHRAGKAQLEPVHERAFALFGIGGLGQRLDVYPAARLVAVRQHTRRPGDDAREGLVTFRSMPALTLPLTRGCSAAVPAPKN